MSVYYLDYRSRIKKIQTKMMENGLDALILSKFGSLCYFTGLVFKDRAAIIIPAKGREEDIFITLSLIHISEPTRPY